MTIKQKAPEIADKANRQWLAEEVFNSDSPAVIAARLGIIEGLEMALKIAVQNDSMEGHGAITATAIRALIEEQKL